MRNHRSISLISLFFLLAGCTLFKAQQIPSSFERPVECQAFLNSLDERVERAGVKDGSSHPIPGFPYLRASRFLAHLKDKIDNQEKKEQWAGWMKNLDLEARVKEIRNLPEDILSRLSLQGVAQPTREKLSGQAKICSDTLFEHDKSRPDFYATLIPLVDAPDEYSFLMRAVGLYPVMAIPVAIATDLSRRKIRSWYEMNPENLPVDGRLRSFIPAESRSLDEEEIQAIISESRHNPLGVPLPDEDWGKKLVEHFAPVFIQDSAAPYDQIGRLAWRGDCPDIEEGKPTVYYYFSHALLKGGPILQINYVIWYSKRAGKRSPAIERGHLDGLTLRVSLDEQGKLFMVDAMSDCGCYHLFAPDKGRVDRVRSKPLRFDPFVPQWLPVISQGERLGVRLNSGWHQVQRLIAAKDLPEPIPYELAPYDILESLPRQEGRTESIFDSSGIAKCSKRTERFILFSMGIPEIGSMRQRSHHAIELIGRVQFDDPGLFDESFVLK
jgi:hypothetical protein